MEETRSERDGAAEVMRDDVRPIESPVFEERCEQFALRPEVDSMRRILGRRAVPRHVPEVDREPPGHRERDRTPEPG